MKPPPVPIRTVYTYARFTPDGPDKGDPLTCIEFYTAAMEWIRQNQAGELTSERPESKQVIGENDRELSDIERSERLQDARVAISNSLHLLTEAARMGDAKAAELLVEAAKIATIYLVWAERTKPELLRRVASLTSSWPVMAQNEPGWEKAVIQRLADLDLGSDFRVMRVRFRTARGTDANLPARRWAKAAVRVAEETRSQRFIVGTMIRDFDSCDAFADFLVRADWKIAEEPGWVKSVVELKPFSKDSLPDWKPVVREMIRDQVPDFHNLPEWQNQRNTAAASDKTTKGEIRNAILDDIISALERLAPDRSC